MIEEVISGAQTGADIGALIAAKKLGLKTGGTMPKGFRTATGPRPEFVELYGVTEHSSSSYPPRTEENVKNSDGTLIFGLHSSPGSRLTINLCKALGKPYKTVFWAGKEWIERGSLVEWADLNGVQTLNVAGNREEKNPGISSAVEEYLLENLSE